MGGSCLGVFLLGAWGGEWSSLPQEAGARAGAHELMSVSRGCEQVSPLGVPTQTGATAWLHLSLSLPVEFGVPEPGFDCGWRLCGREVFHC